MERILERSRKYGQFTQNDKKRMANLIRKKGYLPTEFRKDLWILSSGAERGKRNNPDYYLVSNKSR